VAAAGLGHGLVAFAGAVALSHPRAQIVGFTLRLAAHAPEVATVVVPELDGVTLDTVEIAGMVGSDPDDDIADVLTERTGAVPQAVPLG
jgi:hypothetical protein